MNALSGLARTKGTPYSTTNVRKEKTRERREGEKEDERYVS